MRHTLLATALLLMTTGCAPRPAGPANDPDERAWIQLFNGTDLKEWDIKFTGFPLNENIRNTFRVEDSLLKVRYDEWTAFDGEFGHIFSRRRSIFEKWRCSTWPAAEIRMPPITRATI